MSYESWVELATKADYEGGILDMIFGYGLSKDDLPEKESRLAQIVIEFIHLKGLYWELMDLLPEPDWSDE